MKKISTSVLYFLAALAAFAPSLVTAAIDGTILLVSSDPTVLSVENLADGTFKIHVVGPGLCQLTASGDADLGDGFKTISTVFEFEVFDQSAEADHFTLTTSDFIYKDTAATNSDTADPAASESQV